MAAAMSDFDQAIVCIEAMREGFSTESSRAGFFAIVKQTFAHAILLCLEMGQPQRAFDLMERARARAFLDLLAAGSPDLAHETVAETLTGAEVQAHLPEDTLLIEYFTTGLVEARDRGRVQTARRHQFPAAKTLITMTGADLQVFDTGLSPNDVLPTRLEAAVERHFLQTGVRGALFDKLLAPLSEMSEGKRRLIIIPHGPLHYVPFAALLAGNGQTLLREPGPELVFAASASAFFRPARVSPQVG